MANERFEMVAKTFQGLEDVLAEELRALGAENVETGKRMVSFEGDLELLYRANLSCRTALRILKPIYKFIARNTDELYEYAKEFDWGSLMTPESTFSIDTVAFSDEFTHSRFVTYRVKDAIVDWFKDRFGDDVRPGVRLQDADVMINVHIAGDRVTLSLDSSGESLHKRGYRVAQTEAPINEVLAAGIILKSGWKGDCPLVDPMCGSGTFLIEAALIAANINPGVYRKHFSFENWPDFDAELFDRLYNDDSNERDFEYKIYGADISPKAIEIAEKNIKSAGVARMIQLETKPLSAWTEAPENGIMVTNPPYGERISAADMDGLYELIGQKLKNVFKGYHAWIIGLHEEHFNRIGLAASTKEPILNGALQCQLREYVIFEGDYKHFRSQGGRLRDLEEKKEERIEGLKNRKNKEFRKERKAYEQRKERKEFRRDKKDGDFKDKAGKRFDRDDRKRDFKDKDKRFDRSKRFDKDDHKGGKRFDKDERKFDRDFREKPSRSDNPLATRRNPLALKSITGKQPTLPVMRSRKDKK
jgi:putative N6-adenine-specific DNA methylase